MHHPVRSGYELRVVPEEAASGIARARVEWNVVDSSLTRERPSFISGLKCGQCTQIRYCHVGGCGLVVVILGRGLPAL
jgi:hypothetical protein